MSHTNPTSEDSAPSHKGVNHILHLLLTIVSVFVCAGIPVWLVVWIGLSITNNPPKTVKPKSTPWVLYIVAAFAAWVGILAMAGRYGWFV